MAFIHPSSAQGVLVELKQVAVVRPAAERPKTIRLGDIDIVTVSDVGMLRYSSGSDSNAAFSRIASIFALTASLGSTALSAAYASAALVQLPAAS